MVRGMEDDLRPAQYAALEVDLAALRLARRRGSLDLAIGSLLLRLVQGDRLLQLGFARQVDYARERLGVSARTWFLWLRLARGLATRPVLRRAVATGAVTPRKALAILPVATGEKEERAWTAAAMNSTVAALGYAVKCSGADPPVDTFEAESLLLRMDATQQDRLDTAISMAQETLGLGAPRWQCVEAICQEWLGTYGAWCPDAEEAGTLLSPQFEQTAGVRAQSVSRCLGSLEELESQPSDAAMEGAHDLDGRVRQLIAVRRGFDEAFGTVATQIVNGRLWSVLGYRSLAEYCRERLGVSPRSLRERVWLERRMCALPELRRALSSGRLTYSKALLVAKDATPVDVRERIREAGNTTWQQLDRESTASEERRNRAVGVRRVWGPRDAAGVIVDAISSARALAAAYGECIDAGEALAVVADHFIAVWDAHRQRPRISRDRRYVLMRHGGLCAVPGCSRSAQHEHHVQFRSRGGSDDAANRVAVCAAHHLQGIHRGYLTVAGRAGERLVWDLGTGDGKPSLETWVTHGDDDVRLEEEVHLRESA